MTDDLKPQQQTTKPEWINLGGGVYELHGWEPPMGNSNPIPQTTARGPFRFPCVSCLRSRDDQISETLMDADGQPLCRQCWEREYGDQPHAE